MTKSKTGLDKQKTQGVVFYNDKELPYTIITNKKLKNLYIEIHPQEGILVKNPNFSLKKVEEIVQFKAKWIYQKTSFLSMRKSIQKIYEEEQKVLLLGEKQFLHVEKNLESFYRRKTQELVESCIENFSQKMGLFAQKVSYRKAKKRWGSCSGKNELNFNTSIAQLPMPCVEYIVVHELAHIKHKHHKKEFWDLVQTFIPNYKECEESIKCYSPSIT